MILIIISTANGLLFLACVVMVVNFRTEYTRKKAEIEAGEYGLSTRILEIDAWDRTKISRQVQFEQDMLEKYKKKYEADIAKWKKDDPKAPQVDFLVNMTFPCTIDQVKLLASTIEPILLDLVVIAPIEVAFVGISSLQAILSKVDDVTLFLDAVLSTTPTGVGMAHLKVKWAGAELREALKSKQLEAFQRGNLVVEKTIPLSKSQLNKQRLDSLRLGPRKESTL